ncbi:MAG: dUTP diphosphatase [Candidatus Atribacteria bacterium]|nr:dUTP diphosphatase [Candidatus Atribacteria bacterium]
MGKDVWIKFKKLSERSRIPCFAHADDACFDLFSPVNQTIPAGKSVVIDLEIASEFPPGYEVVLRPRSGMGIKKALFIHLGTIDAGYRGNWIVRLFNFSEEPYDIHQEDRIVQGALRKIPTVHILESFDLSPSERGENGLGSTGR